MPRWWYLGVVDLDRVHVAGGQRMLVGVGAANDVHFFAQRHHGQQLARRRHACIAEREREREIRRRRRKEEERERKEEEGEKKEERQR